MTEINATLTTHELEDFLEGLRKDENGDWVCTKKGTAALLRIANRVQRLRSDEPHRRAARRPNLKITRKTVELVRQLAKDNPKASKESISIDAGLYKDTVRQRPEKYYVEDWDMELTLSRIVDMARLEMNRAANGRFTVAEVAQLRMTNSLQYGDDDGND